MLLVFREDVGFIIFYSLLGFMGTQTNQNSKVTTGPVDEQNSKVRKDSNTSDVFLFDSLATLPWGYMI